MTIAPTDRENQGASAGKGESRDRAGTAPETSLPQDEPIGRADTVSESDGGMTNDPIPVANDEPEVGLTTPVDE